MPWYITSRNGSERIVYDKRAIFAVTRYLEFLEHDGANFVVEEEDVWLSVRMLDAKSQRKMTGRMTDGIYETSVIE